ncbi:autophagy protein 16 [Ceraceosorus guamensis]|uniref:Autophagy protein 16 n=1 Tax=Ceraceosorus guamensis TaxID=1522189 RepID=A0A316W848_9BASI|nr:autophagy protein 16 [Ceraceosorus guamensis]PWN43845.1 autophagy protein 16 [Ceraceosorus guamensis]
MSWSQLIGLRLQERDARESALDGVVADFQQLSRYAASLRAKASRSGTSGIAVAAAPTPPPVSQPPITSALKSPFAAEAARGSAEELSQQLQQARTELTEMYKTQSANAQRLLTLTDLLSSKEASYGESTLAVEQLNRELDRSRRSEKDLQDAMVEKSKLVEMLQDELTGLTLELNQIEIRNEDLKRDNANLLQRWLDRMNDEVDRMNTSTERELSSASKDEVLDAQTGDALKDALRDSA